MTQEYKTKKFYDPMDDILDRPIAYQPSFKTITGSTVAAIFLSQAWYWSKRHADDDGWFYKSGIEWEEETRLSRSEQETARKHCKAAGVIEERLKGVPATLYYRVVKEKVYELLGVQFATIPQTQFAGIQQTGLQDDPKFAGKQQSDIPANINKESETPPMNPSDISYHFPNAGLDWQVGHGQEVVAIEEETQFRLLAMDKANLIAMGAPGLYPYAYEFFMAAHILPTEKQINNWRNIMKEWTKYQPHQARPEHVRIAVQEYKNMTITGPHSLTNLNGIANRNGNGSKPAITEEDQKMESEIMTERIRKARMKKQEAR